MTGRRKAGACGGSVGRIGAPRAFHPVVVTVAIARKTAGRGSLRVTSKTTEKTGTFASGRLKKRLKLRDLLDFLPALGRVSFYRMTIGDKISAGNGFHSVTRKGLGVFHALGPKSCTLVRPRWKG